MEKLRHLNYLRKFTEVYELNRTSGKEKQEAECLNVQYPFMLLQLNKGDLIAGRFEYPIVYFLPQTYSRRDGAGFGYIFDDVKFDELFDKALTKNEKVELTDYRNFWESENTVSKMKNSYPISIRKVLSNDNWTREPGVAFPLYRMAGSILNYNFLLTHGISGIEKILKEKIKLSEKEILPFYHSALAALQIFRKCSQYYADNCDEIIKCTEDQGYKNHLIQLREALIEIQYEKPRSFLAAIQMMFLYNTISGSLNFGRMDDYLGDFLAHDLNNNVTNEETALDLIISVWRLIIERNTAFDGRIIVGGKGRLNENNADLFAMLAMEATRRTNDQSPNRNY
jgi:hypothetical protein